MIPARDVINLVPIPVPNQEINHNITYPPLNHPNELNNNINFFPDYHFASNIILDINVLIKVF